MTFHVLAALLWVGGMLFLAIVGLPMTLGHAGEEPQHELALLLIRILLILGAICAAALLLSGIANLAHRTPISTGLLTVQGWEELFAKPRGTLYAALLATKLAGYVGLIFSTVRLWRKVRPLRPFGRERRSETDERPGRHHRDHEPQEVVLRVAGRYVVLQGVVGSMIVLISLLLQRIHPIVGG